MLYLLWELPNIFKIFFNLERVFSRHSYTYITSTQLLTYYYFFVLVKSYYEIKYNLECHGQVEIILHK